MKPLIIINFKAYAEAADDKAVSLANACETLAKQHSQNIILAVASTDLYRVSQSVSLPVFAQHIDEVLPGKHTGFVTAEAAKAAGASGALISHSEHSLPLERIGRTVQRAKAAGLLTVVCAAEPSLAKAAAEFEPDYIAIEPPELIGGKISVSTAKPELISQAVQQVNSAKPGLKVLAGAGVCTGRDIRKALELGASGVILASGVVLAESPEKALLELIRQH